MSGLCVRSVREKTFGGSLELRITLAESFLEKQF